MKIVTGNEIYGFVVSGAKNIIVNEQNLNKLNVFPVPDGDTGTNLSLTMNSIVLQARKQVSVTHTMSDIAKLSLDNAYGNSGMIFAQYFNGLSDAVQSKSQLTTSELIDGFKLAAKSAMNSVSNPKEGTILTAMREWAKTLETAVEAEFEVILENSLMALRKTVNNTKKQLKVLRDSNVVDAGAQAFYFFVEGIVRFLKSGTLEDHQYVASQLEILTEVVSSTDIGAYRYCSQFLIESAKTQSELLSTLNKYGDSLVVNQNASHTSIHIHTNQPHSIMNDLVKHSKMISHKVDDMQLQANLIHAKKAKMAIITDSIADLPQTFKDDHHCVVLPLHIIIDSVVYQDKLTLKPQQFYQHLDDYTLNPSSSQPSSFAIERLFHQILPHYDEIIGIFVSSKMSGTFENIRKVINRLDLKDKKIALIDSKSNSITQGLLVYEALRLKEEGKDFASIVSSVESLIPRLRIFVSVKNLDYMLRGGRISKTKSFILSKLKLKPVISIDSDGKGIIAYKSISQKSAVNFILKTVRKDMDTKGVDRYGLVYADNPTDLEEFKENLIRIIGKAPEYIEEISPIVGLNAGKGAFAIGYIQSSQ